MYTSLGISYSYCGLYDALCLLRVISHITGFIATSKCCAKLAYAHPNLALNVPSSYRTKPAIADSPLTPIVVRLTATYVIKSEN